jgi:hypothetical protein
MKAFILALQQRNPELYYFSVVCAMAAAVFLLLAFVTKTEVLGVKAWIKPFKFAASTVFFAASMGWFCHYLGPDFNVKWFNWSVILLLGFEIIYIAIQAGRGQQSHFNISNGFYSAMYSLMAVAATAVTLYTAYVTLLFCTQSFPNLPGYYVLSIRLGLILFVIFSLEGFVMGSRLTHTIGGPDGGAGLPILNWSYTYGDPRIAHFIGMHALQIIPLLSFYLIKGSKGTIILAVLYGLLAFFTLFQALNGRPVFGKLNNPSKAKNNQS